MLLFDLALNFPNIVVINAQCVLSHSHYLQRTTNLAQVMQQNTCLLSKIDFSCVSILQARTLLWLSQLHD